MTTTFVQIVTCAQCEQPIQACPGHPTTAPNVSDGRQ